MQYLWTIFRKEGGGHILVVSENVIDMVYKSVQYKGYTLKHSPVIKNSLAMLISVNSSKTLKKNWENEKSFLRMQKIVETYSSFQKKIKKYSIKKF